MTDAASVLAQYGNHDPHSTITAAALEHIDLAVAATMLAKESNGLNIWGSDPGSTGGAYVKGYPVTRSNYLAYRALVRAGRIGRQGCGPAQCTSAPYQDTADALGGCWDPVANMRSGFRGLQRLIAQFGVRGGAQRYNGSGPRAVAYGIAFAAQYMLWKRRLNGATVSTNLGDDDMTDVQAQMLQELHDRLCRSETPWPGGVTDEKNSPYDLMLYGKRNNVEVRQANNAITELKGKLDALTSKVDAMLVKILGKV